MPPGESDESEPDLRARRGKVPLAVGTPAGTVTLIGACTVAHHRAFTEAASTNMAASLGFQVRRPTSSRADEPNLKSQGELRFRCQLLVEADTVRSQSLCPD